VTACNWITIENNFLYAMDNGRFKIFNVEDPAAFYLCGEINIATMANYNGCAIKASRAYVLGSGKNIVVMDTTYENAPAPITNIVYTEFTSTALRQAKVIGHYLLVSGNKEFIVFDIDDPNVPVYVDSIPCEKQRRIRIRHPAKPLCRSSR
jgi:hypothetical protein